MKIVLSKRYWGIRLNREHCAEVPILFGWSTLERISEGAHKPLWMGYADQNFWNNHWLHILIPFNIFYRLGKRLYWGIFGWLRRGHLWFKFANTEWIIARKVSKAFRNGYRQGYETGAAGGKARAFPRYWKLDED